MPTFAHASPEFGRGVIDRFRPKSTNSLGRRF
jgi:hypothetical protein